MHKAYFDKGSGMMSVIKYAFVATFLDSYVSGIIGTLAYLVVAYTLGRLWFKKFSGTTMIEVEHEIGNRFNKFQQEMRATYKKD